MNITTAYDPKHEILVPGKRTFTGRKVITQEQINTLIGCIVEKKMSITQVAKEARMCAINGRLFYRKYVNDPEHKIPATKPNKPYFCTQEQINNLISYITNDNISIIDAAIKTNMGIVTAHTYYTEYLNDPEHKIPMPKVTFARGYRHEKNKQFFDYILKDKMSVLEACRKANIKKTTGQKFYQNYTRIPRKEHPNLISPHTLLKQLKKLSISL